MDMYYLAASGVCLVAFVGSVIYETHRMKKEEQQIKNALHRLTEDL